MAISSDQRYYLKLKALYYLYEEGFTQTEIAKKLNISRVTLGRLLDEAKAEGMIKFEIIDVRGTMKLLQLEEKLRSRFGLSDIKLVERGNVDSAELNRKIAFEAANYLEPLIRSNMRIGLTWGRTLNHVVDSLPPNKSVQNLLVYTLVGGSSLSSDFQPNILALHLIDKYNGLANIVTAPFICQTPEVCSAMKEEPSIKEILDVSSTLDLTLVGIGEEPVRDAARLSDYSFNTETINELVDANAVGDICGNFFDINGELCDTTLRNRIVSIDITELPSHKNVIGIGGGNRKIKSILGALNGHYLDILITDDQTAEAVLELADKQ